MSRVFVTMYGVPEGCTRIVVGCDHGLVDYTAPAPLPDPREEIDNTLALHRARFAECDCDALHFNLFGSEAAKGLDA